MTIDMGDQRLESRPFASRDIHPGEAIDGAVEWKDVLAGSWDPVVIEERVASVAIERGEPLTAAVMSSWTAPPADWWSVELELPAGAAAGRAARVVVTDPVLTVEGTVLTVSDGGAFGGARAGLVALPPGSADAVARAATAGRVTVLLGQIAR